MRYRGREVNSVEFWGRYVEFGHAKIDRREAFSHKVACPNPDHDTTKRHFQVNLREPKVHCFAHCGISGSWEHAVAVIEGLYLKYKVDLEKVQAAYDKHPSRRSVQDREQIRLHERAKKDAAKIILRASGGKLAKFPGKPSVRYAHPENSRADGFVRFELLAYDSFLPPVAKEYLDGRGITGKSIAAWNLGWDSDSKRVVIPAKDENQRLKFLIKRAIKEKDQPKYLYTEGVPKTSLLFGTCQIDLGMIRSSGLILVEGSLDVVWLHQLGFKNAVAILGTGISDEQVKIVQRINPRKIFLMFDKDSAGVTNIQICAYKLRNKYPLYVVKYPKGKFDPQELTKTETTRQLERSVPLVKFVRETGLSVRRRERETVG